MMNGSGTMTYGGVWVMLLIAVILAVLVGVAVYVALRAVNPQPQVSVNPAAPSPRELLDQRLARGEISPEEYTARRPLLES